MKTLPIAILDSAFSAFISFILAFLIINFYIERPFSIIFSVCLSIPIFIIALDRIKKANLLKSASNKKKREIENMIYSLCLLDRTKVLQVFERAINSLDVKTIKKKYGGNAVIRGMNLEEGATTIDRNKQIGGHRA